MKELTARDVMSRTVMAVRDDLTLGQVAGLLADNEISGAPVEDDEGSLLGVVSVTDVNRSAAEPGLKVRQIMTPIADTVAEETPVPEIARIMVANHYHRMVVTRREKPVGIVSSMDLLKLIADL
ncbi:MAG: CBS domain-containing protein [bacterium]|nr:CBS domain-containing protein [bacterium]